MPRPRFSARPTAEWHKYDDTPPATAGVSAAADRLGDLELVTDADPQWPPGPTAIPPALADALERRVKDEVADVRSVLQAELDSLVDRFESAGVAAMQGLLCAAFRARESNHDHMGGTGAQDVDAISELRTTFHSSSRTVDVNGRGKMWKHSKSSLVHLVVSFSLQLTP
jgi:hypothetical protein